MPYTVVFLWISGAHSPRYDHLADYGAARGLTFRPLEVSAATAGFSAYNGALVDALEAELEQARTALSALEEARAAEHLSRAERELLAHPHLPQAPFLMAECLALRAELVREREPSLATELAASRAALEGPRASAFGDAATSPTSSHATELVQLSGLSVVDDVELDGRALPTGARQTELVPGLHHVRVWRAGRPIFAEFTRLGPDQRSLEVAAPPLVPCSADDLAAWNVKAEGGGPTSARVTCQSWALVREEGSGIGVALCRGARCGAFSHWEKRPARPFTATLGERSGAPVWATLAVAGVASVAATGLILWQAGAFERGGPNATTFRYDGVAGQALRF